MWNLNQRVEMSLRTFSVVRRREQDTVKDSESGLRESQSKKRDVKGLRRSLRKAEWRS